MPLVQDARLKLRVPHYGRARLYLGISAVGTFVVLSAIGLLLDLPGLVQVRVGPSLAEQLPILAGFVAIYALLHLPFDLFGGYLLPLRSGRAHLPASRYLAGLGRGVAVHSALLFLNAVVLMLAGRYGGVASTAAAGLVLAVLLLRGRLMIASLLAMLKWTVAAPEGHLPVYLAASADEGFTGAIVGVFRPRYHILPAKWNDVLGPEGFAYARYRRALAVKTGNWFRGRAIALLFTPIGLILSAWLVGSRLGTASGTIEFSLWFSLWSFVGLLILPTFSRRGVTEVDERARAEGTPDEQIRRNTQLLDGLQDGEPDRPSFVESIFHPIPSVTNRLEGPRSQGGIGCWDAARTTVYLSLAGLGLLGRAVHCNCGRPSLWAFLPVD